MRICKKCNKKPKQLAYGQRFNRGNWCSGCDLAFEPIIKKKAERQRAKKEIIKEMVNK